MLKQAFVFLIISFCVCYGFPQSPGGIRGRVLQEDKAVSGATIQLIGTMLGAISGEDGSFSIDAVPAGRYDLQARYAGRQHTRAGLNVAAGDTLRVDIRLQADVFNLDQVVVSANRNEQSRRQAPVLVNVTDTRIFNATQSLSLSEGLSFQPGLRLENNCQNCGFMQVRMNGLDGAYSQILIDGRPVFSALNSIYGLDQIPTNMIERIEVVRGGGSALYGANAIAGTINLITRDPVENSFQLGTNFGLINGRTPDRSLNANASLVSDDLRSGISLFGQWRSRPGYDHNGDGFTELAELDNLSFGLKAFYKPSVTRRLSLEFHSHREFRRGGDNLELPPHQAEVAEELRSRVVGGGITYEQYSEDLRSKYALYLSGQATEMDNYYGAGFDPDGYGRTTDLSLVAGLQFSHNFERFLGGSAVLTTGTEYKWNDMRDEKPGYDLFVDQKLRIFSLYAQHDWQLLKRLKLLSGLRYDHNNANEKGLLNPRVSLLADIATGLQLRAGYARGFRAPQVFTEDIHVELVAGEILAVQLAEGLEAETSDSYTLSLDFNPNWQRMQGGLTLEAFYTRLHQPFVLEMREVPGQEFPILEKRNGDGARVRGVNLELRLAPHPDFQFQAAFTLQQSRYDTPVAWSSEEDQRSARFLRTPDHYGNFVFTWLPGKNWETSVSGVYTGSMLVPHFAGYIPQDRLERSPDFFELNLRLAYTLPLDEHLGIQFSGGVQNLFNSYQNDFDQGPERDAGYIYGPARPRTIFLGLSFRRE